MVVMVQIEMDAITSLEDDEVRIGGDEKDDDDGSDGAGKNRWRRK